MAHHQCILETPTEFAAALKSIAVDITTTRPNYTFAEFANTRSNVVNIGYDSYPIAVIGVANFIKKDLTPETFPDFKAIKSTVPIIQYDSESCGVTHRFVDVCNKTIVVTSFLNAKTWLAKLTSAFDRREVCYVDSPRVISTSLFERCKVVLIPVDMCTYLPRLFYLSCFVDLNLDTCASLGFLDIVARCTWLLYNVDINTDIPAMLDMTREEVYHPPPSEMALIKCTSRFATRYYLRSKAPEYRPDTPSIILESAVYLPDMEEYLMAADMPHGANLMIRSTSDISTSLFKFIAASIGNQRDAVAMDTAASGDCRQCDLCYNEDSGTLTACCRQVICRKCILKLDLHKHTSCPYCRRDAFAYAFNSEVGKDMVRAGVYDYIKSVPNCLTTSVCRALDEYLIAPAPPNKKPFYIVIDGDDDIASPVLIDIKIAVLKHIMGTSYSKKEIMLLPISVNVVSPNGRDTSFKTRSRKVMVVPRSKLGSHIIVFRHDLSTANASSALYSADNAYTDYNVVVIDILNDFKGTFNPHMKLCNSPPHVLNVKRQFVIDY